MKIYVVYDSEGEHTKVLAEAIAEGARENDAAEVFIDHVDQADIRKLALSAVLSTENSHWPSCFSLMRISSPLPFWFMLNGSFSKRKAAVSHRKHLP